MVQERDMPAISAHRVRKSFGRLKVLDDLTVDIPQGVTYCLLGPNGSGKTTFIRAIVGLLNLDSGDLNVLGEPVSRVREIYSCIGYMTQHKALYPDLTLQENMEFFAGLYGLEKNEREQKITELLDMVNLEEHRHRLAGTLSGGMYQRLSLACTLIHSPKLLLLDEPTVGIDPGLRKTFWEYFDMLTMQGKTVLITTHLMDEAEKCKVVGYMRKGMMAAQGSPDEIKRLAGLRPILELWLKEPEKDADRLRMKGFEIQISKGMVQLRLENHDQIKRVLDEVAPLDMRLREPSLEEAFLQLSEAE
jgi:ABC-2 type transport system ATP-binding protein